MPAFRLQTDWMVIGNRHYPGQLYILCSMSQVDHTNHNMHSLGTPTSLIFICNNSSRQVNDS